MTNSHEINLEDIPCPLGCKKNDRIVLKAVDLLHNLPGVFTVVKCQTCNLMRTNPRVQPEHIEFYYPSEYGPYNQTKVIKNDGQLDSSLFKLLKSFFHFIVNLKVIVIPNIKPGRLLEIGCASGSFMHEMARNGWIVEGVEFDKKSANETARLGYKVHAGPLESAPDPNEAFDFIVGWMVLEHLYDPVGSLKKLRQWSHKSTWLALSVPNAGSLEFRMFKDKWYALQLPTHFHHFTPDTLKKVLLAGGWKVEEVHHQRVINNLIVSTGYVLRAKGYQNLGQKLINFPTHAGRLIYLLYPLALLLSFFGQTGRMTILARPLNK